MPSMSEGYDDVSGFLRFHRHGPYAAYVTGYRSAGEAPIRLLTSAKPAGVYTFPPTADLTLGLCLQGGHRAEYDFGAGRWRGRNRPGTFSLLAPGAGAHVAATDTGRVPVLMQTLFLTVPAAAFHPTLADARVSWADLGRLHTAPFRDLFLEALCQRLWNEAAEGNPHGRLFADGAVSMLAATLLRLAHGAEAPSADARIRPRLSSDQLRRVRDLVWDRMDEDLSLADLAGVAGLSESHFRAAFRASVGESPGRHLARLRIERAKELLVATDLPIAQIGFMVGYANQAHFTTAYKRLIGTTPAAYRRVRRR